MCKFRDLKASEIECRIGQVKDNGLTLLLYKDARVDMAILDETVGADNWEREHYECKGNLYCRVGINTRYAIPDLPDRWVWKSDCGAESNTEAEKGEASDSFKRACTNWGIGRELYTAPRIYIKLENGEWTDTTYNGKTTTQMTQTFYVDSIEYDEDGNIIRIAINDKNGNLRFGRR